MLSVHFYFSTVFSNLLRTLYSISSRVNALYCTVSFSRELGYLDRVNDGPPTIASGALLCDVPGPKTRMRLLLYLPPKIGK